MDLFDYMREQNKEKESPLASRLRPTKLEEVVGQQHIIGKDKLLYRAIKADKLQSVIFYGPPGTGKTTLAKVIAQTTSAEFMQINATSAGKKDMEAVIEKAKQLQGMYGKRTILFIDEIHRFNKGQQDYLLPFVEDGTVTLIGATTENPYFEVNGALISRSIIFELKPLDKEDIKTLLHRAPTMDALIAVGSGGFFGKGLGHATQSAGGFLPEFHTDFVFAFLSETFGFCGSFLLLCLYVLLIFSTIRVAFKCESLFLRLSCVGIVGMWAFQTFENIGMCIGMMPITGIPLPFISYGSSFMIVNFMMLGLINSVWVHNGR